MINQLRIQGLITVALTLLSLVLFVIFIFPFDNIFLALIFAVFLMTFIIVGNNITSKLYELFEERKYG